MAIAAYSQVLWELTPGYAIPGPQLSSPVPPNFVWVVREISASAAAPNHPAVGIGAIVISAGGMPLWGTPLNSTVDHVIYTATDVRFVLEEGTQLSINTDNANWTLRVSGYQLSTAPGSFSSAATKS